MYDVKLKVIAKATKMGSNRMTADYFVANEKQLWDWRKVEDKPFHEAACRSRMTGERPHTQLPS